MTAEISRDTSAITAHLDRGWDLLGRGDVLGARVSAQHVLELDGDSSDGRTLLGAISAAEGDAEEALELFQEAYASDPDNLDALMCAAEVALYPLRRFDESLRLCDEAVALLEEGEEHADLQLLRIEALLGRGDADAARGALQALSLKEGDDPTHCLRLGRAWLDLETYEKAAPLLQEAAKHDVSRLDGEYFLGVALQLQGDEAAAFHHWAAALRLEREQPDPPWALELSALEGLARDAVARLPEPLRVPLHTCALLVEAHPPVELVAEGLDPRAVVFVAGPGHVASGKQPPSRSGATRGAADRAPDNAAPVTAVFVYKRNVERAAGSADAVGGELFRELVHEVAAFLGLDPHQFAGCCDGGGEENDIRQRGRG
jgi:Tfp pilus assembly protein PilF/predicted Zn-dependent protease with MMP-like domain